MKRTVILSTNDNPNYLNYLPYVQKAWNMLGWDTLTFLKADLLGNEPYDSRNLVWSVIDSKMENDYNEATIMQVSRLLAHHSVEDGLIMTADVDMIPMANYWNPTDDKVTVYGFDLTGRSQYPICYIAMNKEWWEKLIPEKNISELLDKYPNAKSDNWETWWSVDQQIITERINERIPKDKLMLIDRGFDKGLAMGRVDRADWERTITSPTRKIDAHMLHPFNEEQAERVMGMIKI